MGIEVTEHCLQYATIIFLKFNTLILLVFFMSDYFLDMDQSVKGLPVGALKPFMVPKKKNLYKEHRG